MIPTSILSIWLRGLVALAVIGGVIYYADDWQHWCWGWDPRLQKSVFAPHLGWNRDTLPLAIALLLGLFVLAGGWVIKAVLCLLIYRKPDASPDPRTSPEPAATQRLSRPDGSELHVEFYGPATGTPVVLTHGWGLSGQEWNYLKRELAGDYRLIVWDLPGLGKSTRPANRDYSLDNLAADLDAVLALAGNRPAILVGHSIGGMITLTFCRLFPALLGTRVAGLVLTHTTPVDPVKTTSGAAFLKVIEKPVLVPLMYLTIALSPLVWLMNWLSYFNGSAHLSAKRDSFAGTETWAQIDFAARFMPRGSPAVLARGMLGMMRYDASRVLPRIGIPTLVVGGNKDSTTKLEASELMRAGIPGARLVTLAPAKHLGLIEHHGSYAGTVRRFVEEVRLAQQPPVPV